MANTYSLDLESGSSQYASIADASQTGLDLSTTGTFECWVKFESTPTGYSNIITKDDESSNRSYILRYYSDSTRLECGVNDGTNWDLYYYTWTPTVGVWSHIGVTINTGNASATTFEFFVNGVSVGNGTAVLNSNITTIINGTAPFRIGASGAGTPGGFFDGIMDEVRIWNDVRTSTEISDNKSVELVGNEANLVGYWKLNNNYLDETTNNNDLTSSGSPIFSTDVPFVGVSGTIGYKSLLGVGI